MQTKLLTLLTLFLQLGLIPQLILPEYFARALAGEPKRLVSLSLASDEILLDMLGPCGKAEHLVAVSTLASDPFYSSVVARAALIPGRVHSEPEGVLSFNPDLVFGASFNRKVLLDFIQRKKIPLHVISDFSSHKDISITITTIGELAGCRDVATKMKSDFEARMAEISRLSRVLPSQSAVLYSDELSTMAAGTLFDDLLQLNNLRNAPTQAGLKLWPRVSPEALLSWDPDWVVFMCDDERDCEKLQSKARAHKIWKQLKAVKKSKFMTVTHKSGTSTSHYFGALLKRKP